MLLLYSWYKNRSFLFFLGFLIATVKPQISLLLLLFVVIKGPLKTVTISIVITTLVSAFFIFSGPVDNILINIKNSLNIHMQQQTWNQLNHYENITALFGGTSVENVALYGGVVIGMIIVAVMAVMARVKNTSALSSRDVNYLQFVYILPSVVMPLHRYDQVMYIPFLFSLNFLSGIWRKIILVSAVFFHEYVWDKRLLKIIAVSILGKNSDNVYSYIGENYINLASSSASVFGGILLIILTIYTLCNLNYSHYKLNG